MILFSCGGGDDAPLAWGKGYRVTEDDFHREFRSMLPDDQVDVLEPGGKFDLVTKLAFRKMLLMEAGKTESPDLDEWMEVSGDAWLAGKWKEKKLGELLQTDPDTAYMEMILSTRINAFVALMEDSARAAMTAARWRDEGPSEPESEMTLAPWSLEGSSYLEFDGEYARFFAGNPVFASKVLEVAGKGPAVIPAFGAWAVVLADTTGGEESEYPMEIVARYYLAWKLDEMTGVELLSAGIRELAGHLSVEDGEYVFSDLDSTDGSMPVAEFPGGVLTAEEVVRVARLFREENFFKGVPDEFRAYRLPPPVLDPELDLWSYVRKVAYMKRMAALASEEGIEWPESELELTMTDAVLRRNVLSGIEKVDSAAAVKFYRENRDLYRIPELRSALVAYVPAEWMPDGEVDSFDDLERFITHTDEEGLPLPINPCPKEMFKGYGDAVFSAPESVFTGPVPYPGDEVFVFFEVTEIIPEGETDPSLILPVLLRDCRLAAIDVRLREYLRELRDEYGIEIDSARVRNLDPWEFE